MVRPVRALKAEDIKQIISFATSPDEFGFDRIYIQLDTLPEVMLEMLVKNNELVCDDCGSRAVYLVIDFYDTKKEGVYLKTRMYLDCGICAIG